VSARHSAQAAPAPTAARPEPRLGLMRRRSRSLMKRGAGTRLAPFVVLAGICVAAVVFGVLLEQVILAQSAFKMAGVRREMVAAQARNQELLLEMTKLSRPQRIESYARAQLGMVDPAGVEYLVADVGSSDRRIALFHPGRGPRSTRSAAAASASDEDSP
jgi:cell division protein FtsL